MSDSVSPIVSVSAPVAQVLSPIAWNRFVKAFVRINACVEGGKNKDARKNILLPVDGVNKRVTAVQFLNTDGTQVTDYLQYEGKYDYSEFPQELQVASVALIVRTKSDDSDAEVKLFTKSLSPAARAELVDSLISQIVVKTEYPLKLEVEANTDTSKPMNAEQFARAAAYAGKLIDLIESAKNKNSRRTLTIGETEAKPVSVKFVDEAGLEIADYLNVASQYNCKDLPADLAAAKVVVTTVKDGAVGTVELKAGDSRDTRNALFASVGAKAIVAPTSPFKGLFANA